jgi:glycosyltransferase involved in cell wall biosynthesis
MKALFTYPLPFMLAHGGAQIQIQQTQAALEKVGVTVEPLRWWDEKQTGDVLHSFARIPTHHLVLAQQKGMKVVVADLLTEQGSRSLLRRKFQKLVTLAMKRCLPGFFTGIFNWDTYRLADACVAGTTWEAYLMADMFGANPQKIHVLPNGVEDVFLNSKTAERGKWLVCTATITERKRVNELAEAAVLSQTPVWVVGKAYSESDPYAQRFFELSKRHPEVVRYEGPIGDRTKLAQVYREARGFVLLSSMESLSLSSFEAAACECPLLLSDLPWARTAFGASVSYCPVTSAVGRTAKTLRAFYDAAPTQSPPPRPAPWVEIGQRLKALYEGLLKTSR